jgi:hypothetical protein
VSSDTRVEKESQASAPLSSSSAALGVSARTRLCGEAAKKGLGGQEARRRSPAAAWSAESCSARGLTVTIEPGEVAARLLASDEGAHLEKLDRMEAGLLGRRSRSPGIQRSSTERQGAVDGSSADIELLDPGPADIMMVNDQDAMPCQVHGRCLRTPAGIPTPRTACRSINAHPVFIKEYSSREH